MTETKKPHGLAAASPELRQKVTSMGGKAISADKKHMAEIGRRGGLTVSQDRAHMSRIGSIRSQKKETK